MSSFSERYADAFPPALSVKFAKLTSTLKLEDPETITVLEAAFVDAFEREDGEDEEPLDVPDSQQWLDESGDLGVTEWKKTRLPELLRVLDLPGDDDAEVPPFPFFAKFVSDDGRPMRDVVGAEEVTAEMAAEKGLRPLRLLWHQYVGIAAMAKRFFRNENVILADDVGVGKTCQCLGLFAWLRLQIAKAEKAGECFRIFVPRTNSD